MIEKDIQRIEHELDHATPDAAAAIAFAAICRMGEIGGEALPPFAQLIPDEEDQGFFGPYHLGMDMLHSLSDGRFVRSNSAEVPTSAENP